MFKLIIIICVDMISLELMEFVSKLMATGLFCIFYHAYFNLCTKVSLKLLKIEAVSDFQLLTISILSPCTAMLCMYVSKYYSNTGKHWIARYHGFNRAFN